MTQCLVAFQAAPRADQQPEPLIETITHLAYRHRRHPRGRQLDGQRDPVESAADFYYSVRLAGLGQREVRRDTARAFDKQPHCGRVDSCADLQRRHRPHLLVGNPQSFAAGGQNLYGRRCRQDGLDQIGCRVEHVLAIVEHKQPDSALQRGGDTLAHGFARLLGDAQHRRHRVGHRRRISHSGQFEQPDAVGKFIGQTSPRPPGPTGLADPAHPGQRHQPVRSERRLDLGDLRLAPDETGGRTPQVSRTCIERPQRRKIRAQTLRSDLEHPNRRRDIPQPARPQIQQINSG